MLKFQRFRVVDFYGNFYRGFQFPKIGIFYTKIALKFAIFRANIHFTFGLAFGLLMIRRRVRARKKQCTHLLHAETRAQGARYIYISCIASRSSAAEVI